MTKDEYYKYAQECLDEEFEETESLYRRFPMAITANLAVGGAAFYLLTDAYLAHAAKRPDAFFYYLFAAVTVLGSLTAITLLAVSIWTKQYKNVAPLFEIEKHRKDQELWYRGEHPGAAQSDIDAYVATKTTELIHDHVVRTCSINRGINTRRRQFYNRSLKIAVVTLIPLALTGIFLAVLRLGDLRHEQYRPAQQPASTAPTSPSATTPSATTAPPARP